MLYTTEHAHTNTQRCGHHHCRHGYLEGQQQQERLNAVEPSVDKVSHEQVVCVRHIATNLEQLFEVIKLTVNISTDLQQTQVKMVWYVTLMLQLPILFNSKLHSKAYSMLCNEKPYYLGSKCTMNLHALWYLAPLQCLHFGQVRHDWNYFS